jgi:hypothetical protein
MKRWLAVVGTGILFISAGCKKTNTEANSSPAIADASATTAPKTDRDAIAEAIRRHLGENKGINMAAMDSSVGDIAINGDQAQANVEFRLKQGGTSMQMIYFLERHAGDWIILRSQPSGGEFSHPPMDQTHSGMASGQAGTGMPNVKDILKANPHAGFGNAAAGKPAAGPPPRPSP